jgi:RNA polymerase sigma factor (sigma-70 family)
LSQGARQQQEVSIQELIRHHHASLLRFLRRRLSVVDDADDIAQETYIRMMKYEGSREIASPSAMLYRVAVNVANDHGRTAQVRWSARRCDIDDVQIVSDQPSAERAAIAQQTLNILLNVIEHLPPKCKEVFLLSREHGMTYPEIARRCGISVKMVEKQISHAIAICLRNVGGPGSIDQE